MLFKRHFVLFLVYTVSSCNSEQDDCSKQGPIIPANESDGGGLDSLGFFKTNSNARINGTHRFFGQELDNMTYNITEPNGTVKFNNGSLEIAVFKSAELAGGYFLYETKYTTKNNYTRNQIDHVKCLLNISSDVNFGITVMTWENYSYCNERENITFQLALASDSNRTFALLLYNGTDYDQNCNPPVVTGFKAEGYNNSQSFQHLPLLRLGNAKSVLRTGNAGMKGVFIYRIDDIPQPINDLSNCDCNITDLTNGIYEVTTSDSGCWASYQCNSGYTGKDINIISGKDIEIMCTDGNWSGEPPTCEAIDLLIPYTGDYFDMILRRQRTGYNVKHMISPQPPFEKELMRLFIYDNGAVSFGNRLGRGSPNITATGNLSFENVEVNFFVNPSNRQLSIRRDQILNLLKRNETEGAERFNPKNMVVVTWTNVRLTTCDKLIRFQIALVSGDLSGNEKTYALLINNLGEGCEIQYTINGGKDLPKVHKQIKLERNAAYVYAFQ